jgi:L-rhamnose mutarotase
MKVNAGAAEEYERRHRPIWPELEEVLLDHGVRSYSIFLDPDAHDLFGYVEVEDEAVWARVAATDACRRWWRFMSDVMPTNGDHSPVSRDLREVFHIERETGNRDSGSTHLQPPASCSERLKTSG